MLTPIILKEFRALVATYLEGSDDSPLAAIVLDEIEQDQSDLQEVLALAAHFQDDYTRKLPVVAAFRRWRSGQITTDEFLKRLSEDDLGPVLGYEPVPPMRGLTILNDHRETKR